MPAVDGLVQFGLIFHGDDDVDACHVRLFRIASIDALNVDGAAADEAGNMVKTPVYCRRGWLNAVSLRSTFFPFWIGKDHFVKAPAAGNHGVDFLFRRNDHLKQGGTGVSKAGPAPV